jgi:uncharacterized oxidoreductase
LDVDWPKRWVLVEIAKPLRNNPGPNEAAFVKQFNDMMTQ